MYNCIFYVIDLLFLGKRGILTNFSLVFLDTTFHITPDSWTKSVNNWQIYQIMSILFENNCKYSQEK